MDEELKTYLQGMEDRTAALIAGEVGSLHTQIQRSVQQSEERLGARAMARFSEYGETSDERWVALVTRVEALERKLENGTGKNPWTWKSHSDQWTV